MTGGREKSPPIGGLIGGLAYGAANLGTEEAKPRAEFGAELNRFRDAIAGFWWVSPKSFRNLKLFGFDVVIAVLPALN